jgi:hypothetical protein
MVINRDYMLKKSSRPSEARHFLHTQLVPRAVNIAGGVEVTLSRASAQTGIRPAVILAGVAAATVMAMLRFRQRRRDRRTEG